MACGFKTFIFIVAYCFHMVWTFDGCSTKFYGEFFSRKYKDYALENLEETNAVNQIPTGKVNDDQRTTKK